jgi:hypothetical protein
MRRGYLLGAIVAVGVATALVVLLAMGGSDPETAATTGPKTTTQKQVIAKVPGANENCSTRSQADFGPAFASSDNLVVGPLAMIAAGTFTPPSVVRDVHGQKYPLLVKAGHRVTLEIPASARGFVGLGYGPLPEGEITLAVSHPRVTFTACARGEPSGSTAGGPVTFWSGGLVADAPHCVPLDVFVDEDAEPTRVYVELGARC